MAQRKWNPVPGVQHWGTSTSPRSSVINKFPEVLSTETRRVRLPSRTRNRSRNYYEVAEEVHSEEELSSWLKEDRKHGALRVYQSGSTYSDLIRCKDDVSAEVVMSKCVATELYIDYAGQSLEPLAVDSKPLEIQKKFLRSLGYVDHSRIQIEGMHKNLATMFKFVAGKESKADDKVQLTCTVKYKELGPFGFWSKRFCVLCGPKLYVFSSSKPKGRPSTILDLAMGVITEQSEKKHLYCIQVATNRKIAILSFATRLDQSIWLKKAAKVVKMHPLEANLSRCNLDQVPQYLFLNRDLAALNLSHNFMYEIEDGPNRPPELGFINDFSHFQCLKILSLSDNNLFHFPPSVCSIQTLTELDLSCNRIALVPKEIKNLKNLSTLLLHSNLLSSLPYPLNELHKLTTLVVAFNRFKMIPHIVKELQSLRILIIAGNRISTIPEDIHRIQTLQVLDLRLNQVDSELPSTTPDLPNFFSINLHGNRLRDFDMRRAKNLHVINLSDNNLTTLSLHRGKLSKLNVRNNKINKMIIPSVPSGLTSLDLVRNELSLLPDSVTKLLDLQKLILSHNKLTVLPKNLLRTLQKLTILQVDNNSLYQLPLIGNGCSIQILDVHSNKIKQLPDDLFIKCTKLESLNISGNPITSLPSAKRIPSQKQQPVQQPLALPRLTELRAANCALTPNAIDSILSLKKLKILHLAYNSITIVSPLIFTSLPDLQYLSLAGNGISTLQSPSHGSPHLICLILHSNNLKGLPQFPIMPLVETLDVSLNDLRRLSNLNRFIRLKTLDLSHNSKIVLDSHELHNIRFTDNIIATGIPGSTISSIKSQNSKFKPPVTSKSSSTLVYAYGESRGTNLEKTREACTRVVALPVLREKERDGLFALIDGGKVPDAAEKIRSSLASTLKEEILAAEDSGINNPLLYLEHTFLTLHRDLGPLGLKYGASMVLCHIVKKPNGDYQLNTANTGLGEAILCTGSHVTTLTNPHNPATNREEAGRVAQEKGFISEDDRVNGLCGVSRLLGCYYLYPQVIPLPSTKTATLPPYTNFLVMGTHGLWKYISQKEIYRCVRSFRDPVICSKRLADLAIANGCPLDVSVIVAKIVLGDDLNDSRNVFGPLDLGLEASVNMIEEEDEEEDEELAASAAENYTTNIDDLMEDSFADRITPLKDTSYLESEGLRVLSPEQLDALVKKDLNVEDLKLEENSIVDDNELIREGSYLEQEEDDDNNDRMNADKNVRLSQASGDREHYSFEMSLEQDTNVKGDVTDDSEDESCESEESVESDSTSGDDPKDQIKLAKSVPEIKAEYELQLKENRGVQPMVESINVVISQVRDEELSPEEEQAMKMASVQRKRSFVQSAYNRLSKHAFDSGTSFHSL